jgi:hypothetical protein
MPRPRGQQEYGDSIDEIFAKQRARADVVGVSAWAEHFESAIRTESVRAGDDLLVG